VFFEKYEIKTKTNYWDSCKWVNANSWNRFIIFSFFKFSSLDIIFEHIQMRGKLVVYGISDSTLTCEDTRY
jgi:hypothetical protein